MTIEKLYQILKKNVEAQLISKEEIPLYTVEYDTAVFEYMSVARDEQTWIERLNAVRAMEKSISQFLVQQTMARFNQTIVGFND